MGVGGEKVEAEWIGREGLVWVWWERFGVGSFRGRVEWVERDIRLYEYGL